MTEEGKNLNASTCTALEILGLLGWDSTSVSSHCVSLVPLVLASSHFVALVPVVLISSYID